MEYTKEQIEDLNKRIKAVFYSEQYYEVAEFKQYPHGIMVGIMKFTVVITVRGEDVQLVKVTVGL